MGLSGSTQRSTMAQMQAIRCFFPSPTALVNRSTGLDICSYVWRILPQVTLNLSCAMDIALQGLAALSTVV